MKDLIKRVEKLEAAIFNKGITPEQTTRVLEDLQDRACNNFPKDLVSFTNWLRSLYPELYDVKI